MELAGGGFPAVILLNHGPIDRDRYIAVNPNFHVQIRFNGIQVGSAQVGQALWPREKNLSESWPRRRPDKRVLRQHHQTNAPTLKLDGFKPSRFVPIHPVSTLSSLVIGK